MIADYIGEIDFSVKMNKSHTLIPWRKILKKVKGEEKKYSELDYAFGIYQIQPCPSENKEGVNLAPSSEIFCK